MNDLVGSTGYVTTPTRGLDGIGEVSVKGEVYLAWSTAPLPKGTRVLVLEERGVRTLQVEPL